MANKGSGGGGGGSAGAVRAGRAFVEIFGDNSKLERDLKRSEKQVGAFGAFLTSSGKMLAGAGGVGLGAAAGALAGAVSKGADLQKLADKLNVNAGELSAFAYAAERNGQSLDDLTGHWENFAERVFQGAAGTGEAADAFKRLGIDAAQLSLQSPIDQLITLSDAVNQLPEGDRLGLLSSLGGDQFQNLTKLFRLGSGGIRGLMTEGVANGAAMSAEAIKKASDASSEWSKTWDVLSGNLASVAVELLPSGERIAFYAERVRDAIAAGREWVSNNAALVTGAVALAAGAVALGGALVGVGTAASVAATGIGLVASIVGALLSPVGLFTAAVVGLTAAFLTLTPEGKAVADMLGSYFAESAATATAAWGGIVEALKSGDLALAGKIALAALDVEWQRLRANLMSTWREFVDFFADGWDQGIALVAQSLTGFIANLKRQFGESIAWIANRAADLAELFGDMGLVKASTLRTLGNASVSDLERAGAGVLADAFDKADERRRAREGAAAGDQAAIAAARAELARLIAEVRSPATGGPKAQQQNLQNAVAGGMKSVAGLGVFSTGGYGAQIFGDRTVQPIVQRLDKNNVILGQIKAAIEKPQGPGVFKP